PPGFPPLLIDLEIRQGHLGRERTITNARPDLQAVAARRKPRERDYPLCGVGPMFLIQAECKAHELLALVVERGELGPTNPRLLVHREPRNHRIGNRRSAPATARRPVVSQSAAGADPDAAVRIGPKGIPVGLA